MADKKLFKDGVPIYGDQLLLRVSRDKLTAVVVKNGEANPDMAHLDTVALFADIKNQGVVSGLLDDPKLQEDGTYLVAQGRPAVHGDNASFTAFVQPSIVRAPKVVNSGSGKVDYRELGAIVNVPKDKLLIKKTPPTQGEEGENVFGDALKAKPGKDKAMKVSAGVRLSEDGLEAVSELEGKFMMADGKASVVGEHIVSGDVDMKSGNISFVGSRLLINGTVLPGFRVKCKGDIYIAKGVEGAKVQAGGNLEIKGGVIGEDVHLQSWKDLSADFVENVGKIEVRGNLNITDSIIQAKARVGGDMSVVHGKGTMIGGEYVVGGSVRVKELGSDAEVVTTVQVGLNPELEGVKKRLEADKAVWPGRMSEILKNTTALKKMKKEEGKNFPAEKLEMLKKLNAELPEVMDKVNDITMREEALAEEMEATIGACVYVYEKLYPGVAVTIGDQKRVIASEENQVVIYFDKSSRKIKLRPMTDDEKGDI